MNVLIMGFTKVKFMPYLNFYYDNISKENNIHILYWNRDLSEENLEKYEGANFHEFGYKLSDEDKYSKKAVAFFKYRKFAKKIIEEYKFDFIFVLHSLPGVLISDLLGKKYKNKYVFDYRDSTYESIGFFQKQIDKLVKYSCCTFTSSDGFREFLPKSEEDKIFTSHNLLIDSLNYRRDDMNTHCLGRRIKIAFWGFIRHKTTNIQLIDKIGRDDRFELHYYGRELEIAKDLQRYVKENEYKNIFFHGEYNPEQRYEFMKNTDMIHNIYLDANTLLAMGNKFYDGIIFRIPQICMKGSFMGKKCVENGIGMECDPADSDFCEKVYLYYQSIDKDAFFSSCDMVLEQILMEYKRGCQIVSEVGKEK